MTGIVNGNLFLKFPSNAFGRGSKDMVTSNAVASFNAKMTNCSISDLLLLDFIMPLKTGLSNPLLNRIDSTKK